VDVEIAIADLYRQVQFEPETTENYYNSSFHST
jgi:hypothetical protein